MPHSQQKHAYRSNTHKIRRNLKTKYNDNKKQRSVFGMYTEVLSSTQNDRQNYIQQQKWELFSTKSLGVYRKKTYSVLSLVKECRPLACSPKVKQTVKIPMHNSVDMVK